MVGGTLCLKVHKNENVFGFDFEFCPVSLLVTIKYEGFVKPIFDWDIMRGGRIFSHSLKTTENKNCFQPRPKKIFLSYDPFKFAEYSFSKIRSINCDRDGFMC